MAPSPSSSRYRAWSRLRSRSSGFACSSSTSRRRRTRSPRCWRPCSLVLRSAEPSARDGFAIMGIGWRGWCTSNWRRPARFLARRFFLAGAIAPGGARPAISRLARPRFFPSPSSWVWAFPSRSASPPHPWPGSNRRPIARRVGRLYSVNVLGAIAGALTGGFLLLPLLGTRRALIALAAVYGASAVVLIATHRRRTRLLGALAAAVVLFGVLANRVPDPFAAAYSRRYGDDMREFWREEGVQTAVSVHASLNFAGRSISTGCIRRTTRRTWCACTASSVTCRWCCIPRPPTRW